MNYWCLNPGVTFNKLLEYKPVSIILTSGTLSPMETYEAELKIPFDTKLSCSHVIDTNKQLFVRVCKRSQTKIPFNFSFQSRENNTMISELANSIINMLVLVPGGALVFFPSYHLMDTCVRKWETDKFDGSKTFFEKIETRKVICIEVAIHY